MAQTASTPSSPALQAALAAHRFGIGQASLASVGDDPVGWLTSQIGAAEPQRGDGLASGVDGLRRFAQFFVQRQQAAAAATAATLSANAMATAPAGAASAADLRSVEQQFGQHFRNIVQADQRARLTTAAQSQRPFNERLALFWANHFTVSMAKASARGIVGAFEREAIRPHIGGSFEQLLTAAVTHPGMLRYLDNDASAGPDSAIVRRLARQLRGPGDPPPRVSGLNENLAREVLELHTLGVAGGGSAYGGWGGYTQADVTAFARVLTGWRVPPLRDLTDADAAATVRGRFEPAWHQPGPKSVLGTTYREGPDALPALLHDLAQHPSTARFVCAKLARHVVADDPPPALVARLEAAWRRSGGDLPSVYRALIAAPEAWTPQPAKLKTPEEFVISTARLLNLPAIGNGAWLARAADAGIGQLGQRIQAAPSPAGWPDRAEEWLGPDAVWKRVEWAARVADRLGRQVDARALAHDSLGPLLSEATARQIDRAADGPQALALLLLAPEFQRR